MRMPSSATYTAVFTAAIVFVSCCHGTSAHDDSDYVYDQHDRDTSQYDQHEDGNDESGGPGYESSTCEPESCWLPGCRCEGTDIPGGLDATQVPQIVMLTFDDHINPSNFDYYRRLGLVTGDGYSDTMTNPNGCPARATFFVSDDYTVLDMVKALADHGNEIASHTFTHGHPEHEHWNTSTWAEQVQGMRRKLAQGMGRPLYEVRGMRSPYLELNGEVQFAMLQSFGFLYDSSMNGGSFDTDPIWPFTLHVPPTHVACDSDHCPHGSYPRLWEVPLVYHFTPDGKSCPMADACGLGGADATKERVLQYLWFNFNRSYLHNRAPYMICLHATWFGQTRESLEALEEFLHVLGGMHDVWRVTMTQMLDWVRHPLPVWRLDELPSWQC